LYPPLALGFFAIAASAGVENAQIVWKLILLIAGLMTLWITVKVLHHANKLEHLALVALSPLLILETQVGLHLDALSTLAVISAIYCWQRQWVARAGLVIGLGTLIKLLPIMLLLPLIFTLKSIKQVAALVIATLITIASVYLLTISLGFHPVGSISVFFEKWRFAAPLFVLLDNVLTGQQILIFMIMLSTLICSTVAYCCWRNRRSLANNNNVILIGAMQLVIALPLIVSPVTFPWYLMPLIPLMALSPNRYLIIWTLLMPLTYEVIGQFICCHIWQPALWPIWLIGLLQLSALLALLKYCYGMLLAHLKKPTS
jgi:alpha-1,6-mannosyltransferase